MNGKKGQPQVSVIVPTLASAPRGALLQRAIASIRASSSASIRIIVVVNGSRFDTVLCDWLKTQMDIHFEYVAAPSAPGAILRGRELLQTEFFSTLDDDDEYLPGATDKKVALLRANAQAVLLVANAYQCCAGVDSLLYERLSEVPARALECLMQFNWLTSGNALYRTASIGVPYFKGYHDYAEWTWLAFRLAMDGQCIAVMDEPACRHHSTAQSLSKSDVYFDSYMPLFKRMLERAPPPHVVRMIRRKMGAACHDASLAAWRKGHRMDAWRRHWLSLVQPGGWRYLMYTRHLLK